MRDAIKSEFRKLVSVRTTYAFTLLVMTIVILVAFFFEGWKLNAASLHNPMQLASDVTGALNVTVFGAIVAILLMTHEYRYNTIFYTLTSNRSRSKVLLAKFVVVSGYSLLLGALIAVLSPFMAYAGVHSHGHVLVPQTLDVVNLGWRVLFYSWGYGMAGLLLALITRSQVGSIVALFLIPTLVESLIGFYILKHNTVYLPFSALSQVINKGGGGPMSSTMSPGKAAGVYCIYLAVGWAVGWILFLRRDAN